MRKPSAVTVEDALPRMPMPSNCSGRTSLRNALDDLAGRDHSETRAANVLAADQTKYANLGQSIKGETPKFGLCVCHRRHGFELIGDDAFSFAKIFHKYLLRNEKSIEEKSIDTCDRL